MVREFYSNIAHFNLDGHGITSTIRETLVKISPDIICELYDLPKVDASLYLYKGMGAPTKIAMRNLFVGPQGPKWILKINRLSFHVMFTQFRFLA